MKYIIMWKNAKLTIILSLKFQILQIITVKVPGKHISGAICVGRIVYKHLWKVFGCIKYRGFYHVFLNLSQSFNLWTNLLKAQQHWLRLVS